jgi:hypothetical protein
LCLQVIVSFGYRIFKRLAKELDWKDQGIPGGIRLLSLTLLKSVGKLIEDPNNHQSKVARVYNKNSIGDKIKIEF